MKAFWKGLHPLFPMVWLLVEVFSPFTAKHSHTSCGIEFNFEWKTHCQMGLYMYLGPQISDHHMWWCFGKVLLCTIKRDVRNCDERAALAIATHRQTPANHQQYKKCFSNMLLMGDYMCLGPQISDCCIRWCFGTLFVCAISLYARKFAKRTAINSDLPRNSNVPPQNIFFSNMLPMGESECTWLQISDCCKWRCFGKVLM